MRKIEARKIYRVIDANYNRAKEGLRVCEDVCRFFLNETGFTKEYKTLRHQLSVVVGKLHIIEVITSRNITGDVGKSSISGELKRKKVEDIYYANSQRAKESIRVLEEFAKLINVRLAQAMKKIRYEVYGLELQVIKKF